MEWLLRHLVRWLRRCRYARMADRIRALELELGMTEPTIAEMYANPALIGDRGPERVLPFALASAVSGIYSGNAAIPTNPAELRLLLLADHSTAPSAYDHPAADCPKRVEVTTMSDPEPQYIHGACETDDN